MTAPHVEQYANDFQRHDPLGTAPLGWRPPAQTTPPPRKRLSPVAIAGITLGSLFAVLFPALVGWFVVTSASEPSVTDARRVPQDRTTVRRALAPSADPELRVQLPATWSSLIPGFKGRDEALFGPLVAGALGTDYGYLNVYTDDLRNFDAVHPCRIAQAPEAEAGYQMGDRYNVDGATGHGCRRQGEARDFFVRVVHRGAVYTFIAQSDGPSFRDKELKFSYLEATLASVRWRTAA